MEDNFIHNDTTDDDVNEINLYSSHQFIYILYFSNNLEYK